ncbi:hypothetical protein VTL71DRAFT_4472 [Oculimacula yallundae]|uniref:ELYS-like domain-containing protein n=1 Tax=Oculimacula yallundae TaxID=86028 RepID=A0ABR4C256_9HELO
MSSSSASTSPTRSAASPTSQVSRTSIISPATSTSTDETFESLPWILHHILEQNTTTELPIAIMFAINSGQSIPRLKDIYSWWQLDPQGKLILAFLSAQNRVTPSIADSTAADIKAPRFAQPEPNFEPLHCPDDRFMDHGNDALLNIGFAHLINNVGKDKIDFDPEKRPKGLPAHFVRRYCLEQVFVPEFTDVNFDHALTALDYLRDLESTRRNAMREAALKLNITEQNWRRVLWGNQTAMKWVEQTQGNELRIETMYANLFIDLRIWTMTSILLATTFNKADALAMLNTLFPPALPDLPNAKINPKVLYQQRAIFYRYTIDVGENGPGVMNDFKKHLSQPDNRHRWPSVRGTLERYTTLAEEMITEAREATEMIEQDDSEPLSSSKLTKPLAKRGLNTSSFDSPRTALKTPKAKGSMSDLKVRFASLNKKSSQVFGENKIGVYSKSMVDVSSIPEMGSSIKSSVDLSTRRLEPSRTTPATSQPTFDNLPSSVDRRVRRPGLSHTTPAKSQPTFDNMSSSMGRGVRKPGPSRTTSATSPPAFDNLLSMRGRARALSKPMGFKPPPLDELDKMMDRKLMPSPWDIAEEDEDDDETTNSTPKVSFDFDAALGVGNESSRPSLSSDALNSGPSRKAKPNLQIDTEKVTSKQQDVSHTVKSARAFPKFEERPSTPPALRPQTADSPSLGRRGFKSRASSGKLYSAFESRQAEPLPPFATLPIKRREFPEPALMPEPLMINRPRKSITPRTPNVNLFPPRNINTDLASSPLSPASNSPIWDSNRTIFDTPPQETDESLSFKKAFSNTSATALRPSTSSEVSSKQIKKTPTSSSSATRLPSDNLDFLNRPYTGSSSDTDFRSPAVMKKSSFSNIFRRKKSTPAMANEFSRGDGIGISSDTVSRESAENDPTPPQVIKKKNSMSAFLHGKSRERSKYERLDEPTTPQFQQSDETDPATKPVVKKKGSVSAFLHGKSRDMSKSYEREGRPSASMARGSEDSIGKLGILKKQDSMGTFMRGEPSNIAENRDYYDLPIKTPTSGKSARFDDNIITSTSHNLEPEEGTKLKNKKSYNFVNRLRSSDSNTTLRQDKGKGKEKDIGETAEPKMQKKSSFAFSKDLRPSSSKANLTPPQMPETSEQPRGLKKVASIVFGPSPLRTSDSQSTLRPERNVLRKKNSAYAIGGTTSSSSEQVPPVPSLRQQSSAIGFTTSNVSTSRKFAVNADVAVFAQFEAEFSDRRFGSFAKDEEKDEDRSSNRGGPARTLNFTAPAGSGSGAYVEKEGEYIHRPSTNHSTASRSAYGTTSFSSSSTGQSSTSPTSPLQHEFVLVPAPAPPFAVRARDPRDYEEEDDDDVFGGVGSGGAVGGFGGSGGKGRDGRELKKKKSLWGKFGRGGGGEEKERKEEKAKAKEEKRRRELEERARRVLDFAG